MNDKRQRIHIECSNLVENIWSICKFSITVCRENSVSATELHSKLSALVALYSSQWRLSTMTVRENHTFFVWLLTCFPNEIIIIDWGERCPRRITPLMCRKWITSSTQLFFVVFTVATWRSVKIELFTRFYEDRINMLTGLCHLSNW